MLFSVPVHTVLTGTILRRLLGWPSVPNPHRRAHRHNFGPLACLAVRTNPHAGHRRARSVNMPVRPGDCLPDRLRQPFMETAVVAPHSMKSELIFFFVCFPCWGTRRKHPENFIHTAQVVRGDWSGMGDARCEAFCRGSCSTSRLPPPPVLKGIAVFRPRYLAYLLPLLRDG